MYVCALSVPVCESVQVMKLKRAKRKEEGRLKEAGKGGENIVDV